MWTRWLASDKHVKVVPHGIKHCRWSRSQSLCSRPSKPEDSLRNPTEGYWLPFVIHTLTFPVTEHHCPLASIKLNNVYQTQVTPMSQKHSGAAEDNSELFIHICYQSNYFLHLAHFLKLIFMLHNYADIFFVWSTLLNIADIYAYHAVKEWMQMEESLQHKNRTKYCWGNKHT